MKNVLKKHLQARSWEDLLDEKRNFLRPSDSRHLGINMLNGKTDKVKLVLDDYLLSKNSKSGIIKEQSANRYPLMCIIETHTSL